MKQISNKNRIALLFALCLCLVFSQLLNSANAAELTSVESPDGILRLHIRANSDSATDQQIKMKVRDAVLPYFEAADSYEDARTFLETHGAAIQAICEKTLSDCKAEYGAYLKLGTESFPDRNYDGVLYPAGDYDALVIVLGSGGGQNWWCVLYPPLCIVTPNGEMVDVEKIEFESDIWEWLQKTWARWFRG